MKNKFLHLSFLFCLIFNLNLFAQELEINSTKIQYDDINKFTVFEGNVTLNDEIGNKFFSEYVKYNKSEELIETQGETKIITSGGYEVFSSNVILDNKKNIIYSNNKTNIIDEDGNKIFVEMFNYSILNNIFFSKGKIKIKDINNNNYNFSEIYVDENKKKIIGSDIKAFLNQPDLAENTDNDPRFFANTFSLSENTSTFEKGIFTYCKKRNDDKCPPWVLQSKKIKHDLSTKTIYYDNVILKVYDFPIFYSPKFSHPDPTVKRRSGLLAPSLSNSTTLGSGLATPYFWNIAADKDVTITPKLYINENPLLLTEYRQDFINSFIIVDTGYTQGYKKKDNLKSSGGRAHFFSNLNFSLISEEDEKSSLEFKIEKVSNDTYLKVHDVNTSLVDSDKTVLENKIDFVYQKKDLYLGLTPSVYEDTNKLGHLRYEYLLPLTIEKKLMSDEKYGYLDLASNLRVRNFETNKQVDMFVNDFKWKSNKWLNSFSAENYFEALVKNVNYKANNAQQLKNDKNNSELQSVLGYFTKINLFKEDFSNRMFHSLTPKMLFRYAPGHMRRTTGGRLNYGNLFNLNKVNELDVIESGVSTSIGFEYVKSELSDSNNIGDEVFSFSLGQVISEKENKDMPSSTSLDNRFSDIVGSSKYNLNNMVKLNYNFSIDQSYKNFNYNEIGANFEYDKAKFNVSYLQEKNHIGNLESFQTGLDLNINNSTELSFDTKRNLLTNSAEFYNLSYNYINDCLKAGIAYRREFYTDRDVEPTNTLMFTISIIPFAEFNSPGLSR
jgi:LPS-assembly protein|tara:strand:+ start:732 stop:3071 length:2340 start_codon:yes stop_codon:yes gene_type:complete